MTRPSEHRRKASSHQQVFWFAAMLTAGATAALAQDATFSSRVENVRVDVLVTDDGQPVTGLRSQDFEVRDNGVVQEVQLATFEELSLNVVLALDVSGSLTNERLAELRSAGRAIVDGLRPQDKAGLVTFNNLVTVPAPPSHDFTALRAAFDRTAPSSETALVDASYSAMLLAESDTGRALVIVFSDGADTASFLRADVVLATAKRTDAVVYAVSAPVSNARTFLDDLANVTGGRALRPNATNLGATFLTIFNEFRQRYLVSYTPRGVARTGWHRLEVRLKDRRGTVKARPGYLVGP